MAKKQKASPSKPLHPFLKDIPTSIKPSQSNGIIHSQLIIWDLNTKIYLGACIFLYAIAVIFKLHTSSIPMWNQVANDGTSLKKGIVAGKPLAIRSDEWLVNSTFIMSQSKNDFPTFNPSLGYGKTPLLMSLPTYHILSYLRPQLLGFFVLDIERGYSFWWNFRIFGFLIFFFLFLKLVANNDFWVCVAGTIFVFLSSILVWWSMNTDIIIFSAAAFVAIVYLLFESHSFKRMILYGVLFSIATINFVFNLYPPYQIPAVYIFSILLIGFVLDSDQKQNFFTLISKKIMSLGICLGLIAVIMYIFFNETKDTLNTIMHTVYPGQRNEVGGELIFVDLFKEVFHIFLTSEKFPQIWANMSELSSSLLISISVLPCIIFGLITKQKHSFMVIGLMAVHLFFLCWIIFGFPTFLAKITLFYMSPSYRMVYGLCLSSSLIALIFISKYRLIIPSYYLIGISVALVVFGLFISYSINSHTAGYFTPTQVLTSALIYAFLLIFIVLASTKDMFKYILLGSMVIFSLHNITANPLSIGLRPILDNRISKTVSSLPNEEKKKGWVVFGQFTYSNFLKASGLNVISGVQYAPPLEKLKILDPKIKNDSIYNRYAHISFYPYIDGKDSVIFNLIQSDAYAIQMDPCSSKLKKLGIKYVVFAYRPQPAEIRCMELVDESTLPIFRIID